MKLISTFRWSALFVALMWAVDVNAQVRQDADAPGELVVMTSGAFAPALALLGREFENQRGVSLVTIRGASSGAAPTSIPSRLSAGEHADVIILSRSSLDELTERGDVQADTRVDLVRSTIGVAVRAGRAVPDIRSVDAFVRTMRQATSFGYSASVSGEYLTGEVLPKLGIWEEVEPKGVRVTDEPVAAVVARGEVEIGFQQISEILAVEGVDLAGPLPEDLQLESIFSAAVTARTARFADARALIEFLTSESAAKMISGTGLVPFTR